MAAAMVVTIETFELLAQRILSIPTDGVRLVAVDGCGGAGKSTFARRLVRALGGASLVPTDDFASWDVPIDWWPRLLDEVIDPLSRGSPGRYRRYDWVQRRLAEWRDVPLAPVVVIEGVSASRAEWADQLSHTTWVEAPRETRLERGLARDGRGAEEMWERWMVAEDEYVRRDRPIERVDLVVDGAPVAPYDHDREYVRFCS